MERITVKDKLVDDLTSHAFINLIRNLTQYGNRLSKAHYSALWKLLNTYTDMATGKKMGRYAFPLGTGMGKTQSIVSWLMALHDLKPAPVISVAVCASKVEALCEIKRNLIREGVPDEEIGLLHTYRHDPDKALAGVDGFATLPSIDRRLADRKLILLATHARVRGKGGTDIYNLYQGKPRNLLIWDETLLKSDTRYVRNIDLQRGIGWFKPGVNGASTARDALQYLETCAQMLMHELISQAKGKEPEIVSLPDLTPEQIQEYRKVLGNNKAVAPLKALLEMSQEPLRVASTQENDGVIQYDIVVPSEIKNIVILDASHNIRSLAHLDKTIHQAEIKEDMVSYRNVTIHQLPDFSGRYTMTRAFSQKRENRKVCFEIADVVKQIPPDQGILIFTFLPRFKEPDFAEILKRDLEAAGIDTEARILVDTDQEWRQEHDLDGLPPDIQEIARQQIAKRKGELKPRFAWLTWGNETSLSAFSYCSNVIFAGVLHRDHVDLASVIAGQSDDLTRDIPNELVREVARAEIAHCLYQGMCRGSCRIIRGEATHEMNVWLIHNDQSLQDVIRTVMPGVHWLEWESRHLLSKGKIERLRDRILEYLNSLPTDRMKVSTMKIKQACGLQDIPRMTFTSAVEAVTLKNTGWFLDGRSLARMASVFFNNPE